MTNQTKRSFEVETRKELFILLAIVAAALWVLL